MVRDNVSLVQSVTCPHVFGLTGVALTLLNDTVDVARGRGSPHPDWPPVVICTVTAPCPRGCVTVTLAPGHCGTSHSNGVVLSRVAALGLADKVEAATRMSP